MNTNKIVGYRKMIADSQEKMAKLLGLSTTAYRQKEIGMVEFKQSEIELFLKHLRLIIPDITVEEIFFS